MGLDVLGIYVLIITFLFFLSIGTPIAYSIGLSALATMLVSFDALPAFSTLAQRMATGLESFSLLAIPFFILAGQLMNSGGIAMRLIEFAKVVVGRLPGGLALVNVTANMLFGAISGSAGASASAIGTIMTPRMKDEGYDKGFSAAINVTSATTGLSIPPSNILIVYALASGGTSIAALFLAGYIPGILTGLALMLVGSVYAYKKKYPVSKEHSIGDVAVALSVLLIIVGFFYVFITSGFHWIFLIVFWFWLRSILNVTNPGIKRFQWDIPFFLLGGIIISWIQLNTFPVWLVFPAIMAGIYFLFKNKELLTISFQTILMAIAINVYDPFHYITAGVLTLAGILFIFLHFSKDHEDASYLSGTKKLFDAIPSLMMLVVVIGGIIAGIFTATEAAAIAVVYSLLLALGYREISFRHLPDVIVKTVRTSGMVLLLIATSIGLSWVMSFENIPYTVSTALLSLSSDPFVILLIINLALLAVGIFMDMTPAVLVFTPIFLPIVTAQLGLDPIHFGIIMILNLNVGLCTPPVGAVLFIGCSVANLKIQDLIKPLIPFYIAMIVILLLVTYFPSISMWLPNLLGY
ncbi:MAG: TRAP transporter large permease [Marinilabiliaceae bacterium]